ncbi:MAG: class I SAM-dependent methyltransferase [Alphaproteobacteria bacterium]|nr:class I SAM-dependent methyltransferase [Alphaproteobacteria bacterium]
MTYSFIDKSFNETTGDAARALVEQQNDCRFLSPNRGVVSVSESRWREAQEAERHGWMQLWRNETEDRNSFHAAMFDNYLSLRGECFRHAVELGCGPFTNVRLLGRIAEIQAVSLLDPLVEDYLAHPHCSYRDRILFFAPQRFVYVDRLIASSIEDFGAAAEFDLVLLINVIEHCRDFDRVADVIWSLLPPGGTFVFHDHSYHHADVAEVLKRHFDAAHPLRVDRAAIDQFLGRFETIFHRVVNTTGKAPLSGPGEMIYFIGRKPR